MNTTPSTHLHKIAQHLNPRGDVITSIWLVQVYVAFYPKDILKDMGVFYLGEF